MLKFDGIQFFKDFRIRYSTEGSNVSQGWVGTSCPFCNDKSDHLGLHLATGAISCWRCGRHPILEYITAVLRIPRSEAKSIYSRYLTKSLYSNNSNVKMQYAHSVELPYGNDFTPSELAYLNKRMISQMQVWEYDIRSGGLIGEWAYRIVLPIYYNKTIVSATGRSIYNVEPKYFTLPKEKSMLNMKHIFYGMDMIPGEVVAVVEGPLDALRGGPGFIASFGAKLTEEQLLLLREYETVYFIKDSDEAGNNFIKEAYNLSSMGARNVEVIRLEGFKDIGEMPEDEIVSLRKELNFS